MSLRIAHRVDAPCDFASRVPVLDAAGRKVSADELARRVNPNTGALEFRAPLTWTGVRPYHHADGTVTRELRRPEQVRSASHLRGLRLLTATSGHPALADGTPVYLDARGGPGVKSPDGSALRPAADYSIGHVGDAIDDGEIDGYYVPVGWCSITRLASQRGIGSGKTQTSLGYTALLDDTPGVWAGPHGDEEYDIEHLLDHADPRVLQAIADGVVPTVEMLIDGEVKRVPVLGPNHFAAEIWAGRGEAQSEIIDFAGVAPDAPRRTADAAPGLGRGYFVSTVADAAPVAAEAAVQRAARTARTDAVTVARLAPDVASMLAAAPLSGKYGAHDEPCPACGATEANSECATCSSNGSAVPEWLGWIVPATGRPGAGGIAFVAPDGLGLWWAARDPQGGVIGLPSAFAWRGPSVMPGASIGMGEGEAEEAAAMAVTHAAGEAIESVGELIEEVAEMHDAAMPTTRPRLFSMVRQADESGVSGTGHVLDGVVWRNGKVTAAWDTANAPGSICNYDAYGDFKSIHVDAHPGNATILAFDDGVPEPGPESDVVNASLAAFVKGTHVDAILEHSARQADPDKFNAYLRFVLPNGASMILGRFGGGPWQVQSVRFPADAWTTGKAEKWLKAAGLSASQFEAAVKSKSDAIDPAPAEAVMSFVARGERAPYAHDVRGQGAGARSLTMRKIHLPARLADAAGALATAVKAPSPVPVKVADAAMLEVELPEGVDVPMLAAGMQALTDALGKMSGDMSGLEAKNAELGGDLAAQMIENGDLKSQVGALADDAAVGKAHRLAEVVAIAKRVGLTDADVKDKDADAVRKAAVAKRYPDAVKHLDVKPVLDNMWAVIVDAAKAPVATATETAKPVVELRQPTRHADAAGEVRTDAAAAPKISLVTHNYG